MANEHSQIVPSMQPTATVADFKFWCQKVLPLVYDDSLSYYEVLNKMVVYLNQVIDNINADIENVEELEDDFLLLQTYVNNFFDDIDQLVTYTERAEAAQTAAASSAISAASSASNAATSASNSAGSASSAATSALSAMDAKDAAVAAKTAAETALASAQSAATNATNSATAASGSATAASGSAINAAASATAAQTSAGLAEQARASAASDSLEAEGLAVGKQNGVDVDSDSPYYHNNAKYFAGIADPRPDLIYSYNQQLLRKGSIQANGAVDQSTHTFATPHKIPLPPTKVAKITLKMPNTDTLARWGIRIVASPNGTTAVDNDGVIKVNDTNISPNTTVINYTQTSGFNYIYIGFYFWTENSELSNIFSYYGANETIFTVQIIEEKDNVVSETNMAQTIETLQNSIAPTFEEYYAERTIVAGDLFYVGKVLYKATANISPRNAIVVGSNAVKTTLAEVIKAIS